jgi:hypothetical protein
MKPHEERETGGFVILGNRFNASNSDLPAVDRNLVLCNAVRRPWRQGINY